MSWHLSDLKPHFFVFVKIVLLVLVYFFASEALGIGCPIKYFFKKPCPTCGMTRAMLSLLHGDVQGYFSYNAMALPVVFAAVSAYVSGKVKRGKFILCAICAVILFLNLIYYLIRLL